MLDQSLEIEGSIGDSFVQPLMGLLDEMETKLKSDDEMLQANRKKLDAIVASNLEITKKFRQLDSKYIKLPSKGNPIKDSFYSLNSSLSELQTTGDGFVPLKPISTQGVRANLGTKKRKEFPSARIQIPQPLKKVKESK